MPTELWVTKNHPPPHQQPAAIVLLFIGVGLVFWLYPRWAYHWQSMEFAGWCAGLVLMLIGGLALVYGGQESITVDTGYRCIVIRRSVPWGKRQRIVLFSDIVAVEVGEWVEQQRDDDGVISRGTPVYFVIVRTADQKHHDLFLNGYEGQYQRSVAQTRCNRLKGMMQAAS